VAANKNPIKRTSQAMDNLSYDETFDQNTQEVLVYDGSALQRLKGTTAGSLIMAGNLVPHDYDYIALSYTGSNLTGVVYKSGGSGGTTVATLTLAYTGSQLDSITKT